MRSARFCLFGSRDGSKRRNEYFSLVPDEFFSRLDLDEWTRIAERDPASGVTLSADMK
jgi:hypothetical protein